jgi:hypothetical protein
VKRFGWRLIVFALALSVPLAYFVARTYSGMAQEEEARLRFFAETLLDNMERELAMFVREEESRPVDAYAPTAANPARPQAPYVVGYLQNNPDGSLQIPAPPDTENAERLRAVNPLFNQKRDAGPSPPPLPAPRPAPSREKKSESSLEFADRFLRRAPSEPYLGQRKQRTETLYPEQARQLGHRAGASVNGEEPQTHDAGQQPQHDSQGFPAFGGRGIGGGEPGLEEGEGAGKGAGKNGSAAGNGRSGVTLRGGLLRVGRGQGQVGKFRQGLGREMRRDQPIHQRLGPNDHALPKQPPFHHHPTEKDDGLRVHENRLERPHLGLQRRGRVIHPAF